MSLCDVKLFVAYLDDALPFSGVDDIADGNYMSRI